MFWRCPCRTIVPSVSPYLGPVSLKPPAAKIGKKNTWNRRTRWTTLTDPDPKNYSHTCIDARRRKYSVSPGTDGACIFSLFSSRQTSNAFAYIAYRLLRLCHSSLSPATFTLSILDCPSPFCLWWAYVKLWIRHIENRLGWLSSTIPIYSQPEKLYGHAATSPQPTNYTTLHKKIHSQYIRIPIYIWIYMYASICARLAPLFSPTRFVKSTHTYRV